MKKIFSIIAMCFMLQGCYQIVDDYDIARATAACKGIENIHFIQAKSSGFENVGCKDGKFYSLEKVNGSFPKYQP